MMDGQVSTQTEAAIAGWRDEVAALAQRFDQWHAKQDAHKKAPLQHMRAGLGIIVSLGRLAQRMAKHIGADGIGIATGQGALRDVLSIPGAAAHPSSAGSQNALLETALAWLADQIAGMVRRYVDFDTLNAALELSHLRKTNPDDYPLVRHLYLRFASDSGSSTPLALATQTLQDLHPSALARVNRAVTHHQMFELSKLFRFPLFGRNADYFNLFALEQMRTPGPLPAMAPATAIKAAVLGYVTLPEPVFHTFIRHITQTISPDSKTPADVARGFERLALHDRPPAPPLTRRASNSATRPLKIALCLSGQLRGYQRVAGDLARLGLDQHETQTFVHTWKNVGRRAPDPEVVGTVERVFASEAFCKTYIAIAAEIGAGELRARFPQFHAALHQSSIVTADDIRATFGKTTHVTIDDEADSPFDSFTNQDKMHYKIWAAHQMTKAVDTAFDLVIRLRPDKPITAKSEPIDWHALHDLVSAHPVVFTEENPGLRENLVIGDQFAVGTPKGIDSYADTWVQVREQKETRCFPAPHSFQGHSSLGFALFHAGYRVRRMPWIAFGRPQDQSQLSASKTRDLLQSDLKTRAKTDIDKRLLQSLT